MNLILISTLVEGFHFTDRTPIPKRAFPGWDKNPPQSYRASGNFRDHIIQSLCYTDETRVQTGQAT